MKMLDYVCTIKCCLNDLTFKRNSENLHFGRGRWVLENFKLYNNVQERKVSREM